MTEQEAVTKMSAARVLLDEVCSEMRDNHDLWVNQVNMIHDELHEVVVELEQEIEDYQGGER